MKQAWARKPIREIAQHSLGKMLDRVKNKGAPKPYLRNLNVRWFDFELSDMLDMRFLAEEEARYTAIKGDLLICEGGYPGRAAIWQKDEPVYFQKALHRVRFHEPHHAKWVLYYLYSRALDGTLKKHFNGSGIQHFTGEALSQFEVPLPTRLEQQRIVAILDEAFASIAIARANVEKNLQNTRELFEKSVGLMFDQLGDTCAIRRLRDLCDQITDGTHNSPKYVETGIPMLDSKHIREGFAIDDKKPEKFITRETDALLAKRCKPQDGDILISSRGTIGKIAIVGRGQDFNIMGNMILVRLPTSVDRMFVAFCLLSRVPHIESIARGAAQKGLYLNQVRDYEIPLPNFTTQKEIARRLSELGERSTRLEGIYQHKLDALDELKLSLLHEAFSGKL